MAKITTFSRNFLKRHPKENMPTHFVEKILNQRMGSHWKTPMYLQELADLNPKKPFSLIEEFYYSLDFSITDKKSHTIRAGHSWEAGKFTTPSVWSGRPYHSPQIIFAHDIELKKVWEFDIKEGHFYLNKNRLVTYYAKEMISKNDGLSYGDFKDWFQFPKPFSGEILCWDERINY